MEHQGHQGRIRRIQIMKGITLKLMWISISMERLENILLQVIVSLYNLSKYRLYLNFIFYLQSITKVYCFHISVNEPELCRTRPNVCANLLFAQRCPITCAWLCAMISFKQENWISQTNRIIFFQNLLWLRILWGTKTIHLDLK